MDIFPVVTLVGEAEHGELCKGILCSSVWQLWNTFGEPPTETQGLAFAVQSLLLGNKVLFYRIEEEGLSTNEYELCLRSLDSAVPLNVPLGALFLPGVGTNGIIEESLHICKRHSGVLIMTQKDFYDYLTA